MDDNKNNPELVFGLVGPLGVDLDLIADLLYVCLETVGYGSEKIVLSELLSNVEGLDAPDKNDAEYERIESRMDRGDELREKIDTDSVALLAVSSIRESRKAVMESYDKPFCNHAYIIKSIKHANEVSVLKSIYGESFWLVSAYSPPSQRLEILSKKLGSRAQMLIDRDYNDKKNSVGQNVQNAFHRGDVFIDASHPDLAKKQIRRFIRLIFGDVFCSPYKHEYGMFHAFASSMRSSSMARQAGAAILDSGGNLVSTGVNEVPKPGGGVYSADDEESGEDHREFVHGYDSNDREKREIMKNMFASLRDEGWLADGISDRTDDALVKCALESKNLSSIKFMDVTEYGREVHAEMDALVSAARRHESVMGGTMYCTTFPCHICAKHIVSSGIKTLFFIEPYPKSHTVDLFGDSISMEIDASAKIPFRQYSGISPTRYIGLFSMGDVKKKDKVTGNRIPWEASKAKPVFGGHPKFNKEVSEVSRLDQNIKGHRFATNAENG